MLVTVQGQLVDGMNAAGVNHDVVVLEKLDSTDIVLFLVGLNYAVSWHQIENVPFGAYDNIYSSLVEFSAYFSDFIRRGGVVFRIRVPPLALSCQNCIIDVDYANKTNQFISS